MASLEQGQMRDWAVKGAEQRLLEIANEVAAIHRAFPELRRRGNRGPAAGSVEATPTHGTRGRRRGRRRMSADARRRISEAQKARWAKQRGDGAASGPTPAKPARRGGARKMSAAARKRISDAQKKRWAKVRAGKGKAA
jgi:hypothetical protein